VKFSVITVCRNSAPVLKNAMRSLASQRGAEYEWVVVDGASTDGTQDLVRGFDAAPLQFVSEPDGGIYDAMNKAVRMARGDYVFFLNSDDCLAAPNVLARVAAAIDAAPVPPALVIGQVYFVHEHQRILRSYDHLGPHSVLFDSLCHQASFAQRSAFDRHGPFDTVYRLAADFDWLARVIRAHERVLHVDVVVAEFAAGGAHARAAATTFDEVMRVRRSQAGALELALTHALAWLRHKSRRAVGLPARGRP